jgi:hypothetical protein
VDPVLVAGGAPVAGGAAVVVVVVVVVVAGAAAGFAGSAADASVANPNMPTRVNTPRLRGAPREIALRSDVIVFNSV